MSSRGVNKVILVGFLGQDPEIRYMPDQKAVAMLSLATSEVWRDKQSGEQKEKTEWHRVVIFGKLAEIAGEYLRKGSQVYIEGLLRTRKWFDDKLGADRFTTEVVVSQQGTMQMMGSRQQGANQSQHNAGAGNRWGVPQQPQNDQQHANSTAASAAMAAGAPIDFDDDIPFVGLGYGASNPAIYSLS